MAWSDLAANQMADEANAVTGGFTAIGTKLSPTNKCYTKAEAQAAYQLNPNPMASYASNQLVPKETWVTASCGLTTGMVYAGGVIIYIDGTGCHGIVAAQHDIITTPPPDVNFPGMTRWLTSPSLAAATSSAQGTGLANTNAIYAEEGPTPQYAAQLALDYSAGGFNDWYLPSKDELALMFTFRDTIGNFLEIDSNTTRAHYWSSTKDTSSTAWVCLFYGATPGLMVTQDANTAGDASRVRAIRNF